FSQLLIVAALKCDIQCRRNYHISFVDSLRKETWLPMQNPSTNVFC
ncbi:TPA: elongation factor Ts, partial [Klebsiella pneumoniae]|nr:elongation factor Ts [Klebsiella pneumoniae]